MCPWPGQSWQNRRNALQRKPCARVFIPEDWGTLLVVGVLRRLYSEGIEYAKRSFLSPKHGVCLGIPESLLPSQARPALFAARSAGLGLSSESCGNGCNAAGSPNAQAG